MPQGFRFVPGHLDRKAQEALRDAVLGLLRDAPLYRATMPKTGKAMSVRSTNLGPLGWYSDKDGGYRYQGLHPQTGQPWPAIPQILLDVWERLADYPAPPEACLVNFYDADARMGLHRDFDEIDLRAPVVSVSLGDNALFRLGGVTRGGPTAGLKLSSGDVVVLGGEARLAYHGVAKIFPGTSTLLPEGGRINLTMRRVTMPGQPGAST